MKIVLLGFFLFSQLLALETSDRLFDCTEVFKERKNELLVELERIDEEKQALSALKSATEELLKKKEGVLAQKEEAVDAKLASITQKEENIKQMLQKNESALGELKALKMNKIAQTYAKMKASAASSILSGMESKDAASILSSLKPKTVGQILAKMDAAKASELTLLLIK